MERCRQQTARSGVPGLQRCATKTCPPAACAHRGRPLDSEARASRYAHVGHDFSRVGAYTVSLPGDPYEREAETIARRVLASGASGPTAGRTGPATARLPTIMRQPRPAAPPGDPIEAARSAAFVRTFGVHQRLSGLAPPPRPGRETAERLGREGEQAALRNLARQIFDWDQPNMQQITDIVGTMRDRLTPGLRTVRVPASDPNCIDNEGYVVDYRPPVHLCPKFFRVSPQRQTETMIHEAAHLARIGTPPPEEYCLVFDCETSCGGFDVADSWAHFVLCASGRTR